MKTNILLICGSLNQTTMMHKIFAQLTEFNCYFTPFYADGLIFQSWVDTTGKPPKLIFEKKICRSILAAGSTPMTPSSPERISSFRITFGASACCWFRRA